MIDNRIARIEIIYLEAMMELDEILETIEGKI